jgi:hypothetical protein
MHYSQSEQIHSVTFGHDGRPAHYPLLEDYPELLFYIQRNQNKNTVIYEVNLHQGGLLNFAEPIRISWLYFDDALQQESRELNMIQKKLAYGYHFQVIHPELVEFRFVSYDEMALYLAKMADGRFRVFTRIDGQQVCLQMIYVYAEDLGVFPMVKYADLYGLSRENGTPFYKRLVFE